MRRGIFVIITVVVLIILPIGWYLISPAFIVEEVEEASPLAADSPQVNDNLDSMDAETKAEMEQQMEEARNKTKKMEEKMPSDGGVLAQSDFQPRAHEVEGKALLIEKDGEQILRFEDFETINGPDLHVYLSSELGNDDFVDLGELKGTKGDFNYKLDSSIDTDKYDKVLVWCVPFGVLFSYADLQLE